jgi:hypothetical protein
MRQLLVIVLLVLLAGLPACGPASGGMDTAPVRVGVEAPSWILTPVPTADVGVDALNVWDCQTQPEEWIQQ